MNDSMRSFSEAESIPNKVITPTIVILISLTIIGAVFIYRFVSENEEVKKFAWDQIVQSKNIPKTNLSAGLVYQLEGTIDGMSADTIRLKQNGQTKDFDTQDSQFLVVSSFNSFEQWPLNVIETNKKSDFKTGDEVILIAKAVLNTKTPTIGWVLKIKK